MDSIFALIFIVYILSSIFQAMIDKNAKKGKRSAGAPWPKTSIPRKGTDKRVHPREFPFPFPFPFEEILEETPEDESDSGEIETLDKSLELDDYDEKDKIRPWEDKKWGSLGPSLEGQTLAEIESDAFFRLYGTDDFADDFEDMVKTDLDMAAFIDVSDPPKVPPKWQFTSKSALIQGIIMSEVLKRPKGFLRYPINR